jgi:hypothetical protein
MEMGLCDLKLDYPNQAPIGLLGENGRLHKERVLLPSGPSIAIVIARSTPSVVGVAVVD